MAKEKKERKKIGIIILVVALLLVVVGAVVGAVRKSRPDPQVNEAKELAAQIAEEAERNMANPLTWRNMFSQQAQDEQRKKWMDLRDKMEQLTPDQRKAVQADLQPRMQKMFTNMIDTFMKLPKAQQDAILDLFIDRMEQDRKNWEKQRQNREAVVRGPSGGTNPGGGPDGKQRTPEEREQQRKQYLTTSSPEERAKMSEGMRRVNERRTERGLPPAPFGRRPR